MQCRYCGIRLSNRRSHESAQFCSEEHHQSYEVAANRIALSTQALDSAMAKVAPGGFVPQATVWCDPYIPARAYPEELYKRIPAPRLPRLKVRDNEVFSWDDDPATAKSLAALAQREISPFVFVLPDPVGAPPPVRKQVRRNGAARYPSRKNLNKGVVAETKRFPSGSPKGFTSEMPISRLQPSFRMLSGDVSMARTMSPITPQKSGTNIHAGPPNPHLTAVRQAALRMAEKRWTQVRIPQTSLEPMEFLPLVEWGNTAKLGFDATGFNILGDPEPKRPATAVTDVVVNVRSALAEMERVTATGTIRFEPIVWEELEDGIAVDEPPVQAFARALELFEPPAPPKQTAKKETRPAKETVVEPPVIEVKVEEPPFDPPRMCEARAIEKPAVRRGEPGAGAPPADPLAPSGSRIHLPTISIQPLRRPLFAAPPPEPVKPVVPAKVEEPVKVVAEVTAVRPVEEVKPTAAKPAESKPVEAKAEAKPVVESKPAQAPPSHGRKKKKQQKQTGRTDHDSAVEEPDDLGEEVEAELLAAAQQPVETKPPVQVRKEEPAKDEPKKKSEPKPAAAQPTVHFGGMADVEVPRQSATMSLGLSKPESELITPVTGMGMGTKLAIAAVVIAVAGGIGYAVLGGGSGQPAQAPVGGVAVSQVQTAGIVMGEAGWSTDYVNDDGGRRLRQLSFYRPSMQLSDYRVEFEAEIEYKAVSWAVRAANTKSHYILKLVQERGNKGPVIKLQRFPVVENKPGEIVEKELTVPASVGTVYRVQTDVVGDKYRIAINDKTVDQWNYSQLAAGGFSVANEGAERGQIRAVQMWHLSERRAK
jgi:hypothetical protein